MQIYSSFNELFNANSTCLNAGVLGENLSTGNVWEGGVYVPERLLPLAEYNYEIEVDGKVGKAWIKSEGDRHEVWWLRGRGLVRGEDKELKPGRKTIHGDIEKAKEFAEQMVSEEFDRQRQYGG